VPILTSVLIQAVKSIPILAMVLESRDTGGRIAALPSNSSRGAFLHKGPARRPPALRRAGDSSLIGWPRWLGL